MEAAMGSGSGCGGGDVIIWYYFIIERNPCADTPAAIQNMFGPM